MNEQVKEVASGVGNAFVAQASEFPMVMAGLAVLCGMLVGPVIAAFVEQFVPKRYQRKATTVFLSALFGALSGLFFLSSDLSVGWALGCGAMGGAVSWWAVPALRARLPGTK